MASTGILSNLGNKKANGVKMPALFIGHGSPMNAIANNTFTQTLNGLGKKLPRPSTIIVISAHWMTHGTYLTSMAKPKTIHDFGGFPQALFDVQFPAPGNVELAKSIQSEIRQTKLGLDDQEWGLDHGTWSVLKHLYPEAQIPVIQLSLDMSQPMEYHFKLGQELAHLRERGVLIIGSGNIVHNLRRISWEEKAKPFEWSLEFDEWMKKKLVNKDFNSLQKEFLNTEAARLSVPTLDHYLPLLYIIGAAGDKEEVKFEYEEIQNASISMRSFSFG